MYLLFIDEEIIFLHLDCVKKRAVDVDLLVHESLLVHYGLIMTPHGFFLKYHYSLLDQVILELRTTGEGQILIVIFRLEYN